MKLLLCLALGLALSVSAAGSANMNGDYVFSSTPGGTPGLFPKQFADYPGGAESFDVYSPPITTLYSQVWWSPLDPSPIPDEIAKKYAGKGMAIVGWEIDQVRKTPAGDVSVPISASYNHHYVSQMIGSKAQFKKIRLTGPEDPRAASIRESSGHGMISYDQPHYVVEQIEDSALPTYQQFSSANGGEYRKTFHGFTPGYALVVDSPTAMQITPMQIDTWNRDAMPFNSSSSSAAKFVPGPLPRSSAAPQNAEYSGLLECPMTTRITKAIDGAYVAQNSGLCTNPILSFQECYHAAAATLGGAGLAFINSTGSDPSRPSGCSASTDPSSPLKVNVFFNQGSSTTPCAASAQALAGATTSLVSLGISLHLSNKTVSMQMSGPADVWFGVGLGAHAMADLPWSVVAEADGTVSEHKLANQAAGKVLEQSVQVLSNTVSAGVRTVVLSRAAAGPSADYYSFNLSAADASIPFINAVGSGPKYSYHKAKAPATISLLPVSPEGACICPQQPKPFGEASGSLVYHNVPTQAADVGTGSVAFGAGKCPQWPATNLIEQQNPTCDIRHYAGGQWACHHMWSLLDADQEIPWPDQPLVFHHKYRFWVQPYNESYHTQLVLGEKVGSALLLGSPWEYDVPKCGPGVPGCSLQGGTWIHTVMGSKTGQHNFSALNFHCHAPTCLSMSVYACPKGTALPDCNATVGKLICREEPVYGGTGAVALNGTRFDEPGYIAIPDCFWGPKEFGLEPPPDLTGVPLHMVKTANATWRHYGEMAGGQPWVFG